MLKEVLSAAEICPSFDAFMASRKGGKSKAKETEDFIAPLISK
jgi:hypothetical protein